MAAKKTEESDVTVNRLYRSDEDRVLAGVAGGLGEYFEVDPNLIRFIFVLLTLLGGSGLFIYAILWVLVPVKRSEKKTGETVKARTDASPRQWFPAALILLGIFFLLNNFGLLWWFSVQKLWPLVLIILGVSIITNERRSSK